MSTDFLFWTRLKKNTILISAAVGILFARTSAFANPNDQAAFDQYKAEAVADLSLRDWYLNQQAFLVRSRLDREVSAILQTDPAAVKIMADATRELELMVTQQRIGLLQVSSLASPTQYPEIFNTVQALATAMGFPPAAVADTHVSVVNSNEINAYTYSPLRTQHVDLVVFTGLSNGMPKDALKAVLAHELGHQMSQHVLISIVVDTIFMTTARELIPPEEILSLNSGMKLQLKKMLKVLLSATDVEDSVVDSYFRAIVRMADDIKSDPSRKTAIVALAQKLLDLAQLPGQPKIDAQSMTAALRAAMRAEPDGSGDDDGGGQTRPDIKQLKEHLKAMRRLTQSMEITADRWGILFGGLDNLRQSMAWLAGGGGSNWTAFKAQAEEALRLMSSLGMHANQADVQDHPLTLYRITGVSAFLESQEYSILTNPFLNLTDLTLKSFRVAYEQKQSTNSRKGLAWSTEVSLASDRFLKLGALGANLIADLLIQDIQMAATTHQVPHIQSLIHYLNRLNQYDGYYTDYYNIDFTFSQLPEQNKDRDYSFMGKPGYLGRIILDRLMAFKTTVGATTVVGLAADQALNAIRNALGIYDDDSTNASSVVQGIVDAAMGKPVSGDPDPGGGDGGAHAGGESAPAVLGATTCVQAMSKPNPAPVSAPTPTPTPTPTGTPTTGG